MTGEQMRVEGQEFDTQRLAEWAGGACTAAVPPRVRGVTQDTRRLAPQCLYVALRGERFDGHDFVADALRGGAAVAMVEMSWKPGQMRNEELGIRNPLSLIRVADTRKALGDIARAWRLECRAKVVGVTGSSGKTTTKEMLAACLSGGGAVCATRGNLNNDVGLPLSLLTMGGGMTSACSRWG